MDALRVNRPSVRAPGGQVPPAAAAEADPETSQIDRAALTLAVELVRGPQEVPAELKTAVTSLQHVDQKRLTPALIQYVESMQAGPWTFVSSPITGGPRLLQFLKDNGKHEIKDGFPVMKPGEWDEYMTQVVVPNKEHAHEVVSQLRSQGCHALESAATEHIPGWLNADYNRHWLGVVGHLPLERIVACDGWQFSSGTLLEIRTAFDRGVPVQDEHGQPIDLSRARQEIDAAVAEARQYGLDYSTLQRILAEPDVHAGPMTL